MVYEAWTGIMANLEWIHDIQNRLHSFVIKGLIFCILLFGMHHSEEIMKTRILAGVLLILVLLGSCARTETPSAIEVRPGMYMSNDPTDFPFPTAGYTVYIVGESHGNHETKLVFQAYLKKLYREAGLRDVILEEDQAYETDANGYIHGQTDAFPSKLCLRADILGIIREFNSGLSEHEKLAVHLVDVDSPLTAIYQHLAELYEQLGTTGKPVLFPDFSDFRDWPGQEIYTLIDEMKGISNDDPDIVNGLITVKLSLDWYFLGNRLEIGWPRGFRYSFAPIREDIMAKNIKYILTHLNGKPVMAFFGSGHGMKAQGDPNPPVEGFKSWAQRLVDANVDVYSLSIYGASGESYWHERTLPSDEKYLKEFKLADGTLLVSFFDTQADKTIIYTDLRTGDQPPIRSLPDFVDLPASQLYDGIIIFKEFTPMENVCLK
jgi:hypothetical protein